MATKTATNIVKKAVANLERNGDLPKHVTTIQNNLNKSYDEHLSSSFSGIVEYKAFLDTVFASVLAAHEKVPPVGEHDPVDLKKRTQALEEQFLQLEDGIRTKYTQLAQLSFRALKGRGLSPHHFQSIFRDTLNKAGVTEGVLDVDISTGQLRRKSRPLKDIQEDIHSALAEASKHHIDNALQNMELGLIPPQGDNGGIKAYGEHRVLLEQLGGDSAYLQEAETRYREALPKAYCFDLARTVQRIAYAPREAMNSLISTIQEDMQGANIENIKEAVPFIRGCLPSMKKETLDSALQKLDKTYPLRGNLPAY